MRETPPSPSLPDRDVATDDPTLPIPHDLDFDMYEGGREGLRPGSLSRLLSFLLSLSDPTYDTLFICMGEIDRITRFSEYDTLVACDVLLRLNVEAEAIVEIISKIAAFAHANDIPIARVAEYIGTCMDLADLEPAAVNSVLDVAEERLRADGGSGDLDE